MQMPTDNGFDLLHGRTHKCSSIQRVDVPCQFCVDNAWVQAIGCHIGIGSQSPCQLIGKKDIGEFALPIRLPCLVRLHALQIVKVDVAKLVRRGCHVDDAAWSARRGCCQK